MVLLRLRRESLLGGLPRQGVALREPCRLQLRIAGHQPDLVGPAPPGLDQHASLHHHQLHSALAHDLELRLRQRLLVCPGRCI